MGVVIEGLGVQCFITKFVTNITSFDIGKNSGKNNGKTVAKQWLSSVFQAGALLKL